MKDFDDDIFDEHGVLRRDGTYRVPVRLMDGVRREIAEQAQRVLRDEQRGVIDGGAVCGLHGPGFRLPAPGTETAQRAEVNAALWLTHRAMLGDAWQTPAPAQAAPRKATGDALPTRGIARDQYIAALCDAWRTAS